MRLPKAVWISGLVLVIIGATIAVTILVMRDVSRSDSIKVPVEVAAKLTFTPMVLVPSEGGPTASNYQAGTVVDKDGTKTMVFSYKITMSDGTVVVVGQNEQPPQFTDIKDYKEKFLSEQVQQTSSVSTAGGTIYIGRQAKQSNNQLGVIVDRGLIVFLSPARPLEQNEWRIIGDNLDVVKLPKN